MGTFKKVAFSTHNVDKNKIQKRTRDNKNDKGLPIVHHRSAPPKKRNVAMMDEQIGTIPAEKIRELDNDIDLLKEELLKLESVWEEGERAHAKEMATLKKKRARAKKQKEQAMFGGSRHGSTHGQPGIAEEGKILKQRKENKAVREALLDMEDDMTIFKKNIEKMVRCNLEARNAVAMSKCNRAKLAVRNKKLQAQVESVRKRKVPILTAKYKRMTEELRAEEETREIYLRTFRRIVRLVKNRIPQTRLAKDVERVAVSCLALNDRRYFERNGKPPSYPAAAISKGGTTSSGSTNYSSSRKSQRFRGWVQVSRMWRYPGGTCVTQVKS